MIHLLMFWFQPVFAKLVMGAEGLELPDVEFFTVMLGGFSVLGVAVYGALVVADKFETRPSKERTAISLASLAGSLILGWGYSRAALFVFWLGLIRLPAFYYAVPILAGALAALPPWFIIRAAKRRTRKAL